MKTQTIVIREINTYILLARTYVLIKRLKISMIHMYIATKPYLPLESQNTIQKWEVRASIEVAITIKANKTTNNMDMK